MVYENNEMTFTKHIIEPGGFTNYPINAVTDIAVGDSDNDGDMDIAAMRLIYTDELTVIAEQNTLLINDLVNGIENIITNPYYQFYPNPSTDFINIELNTLEDVNINIVNSKGQIILKKQITNSQTERINISGFPDGIYFLKIKGQDYSNIEKIIKI
jgi:hypothetical protein